MRFFGNVDGVWFDKLVAFSVLAIVAAANLTKAPLATPEASGNQTHAGNSTGMTTAEKALLGFIPPICIALIFSAMIMKTCCRKYQETREHNQLVNSGAPTIQ